MDSRLPMHFNLSYCDKNGQDMIVGWLGVAYDPFSLRSDDKYRYCKSVSIDFRLFYLVFYGLNGFGNSYLYFFQSMSI